MNKAIFIDKDGTLIPDIPFNVDPDRISLQPGAIEALKLLHSENFLLIVISNQSGVAHGYFTEHDLKPVESKIASLLIENDIPLAGFYYCPHFTSGTVEQYVADCECRKPKPGMIIQACEDFHIAPDHSWMIGDILHDVEAGKRAGCRTILLDNGNETEWKINEYRKPDKSVANLIEAAQFILQSTLQEA